MNKKIIFLDVDGVLNCDKTLDTIPYNGINYIGLDDDKIQLLKDIIDKTDCYIILSTSWRFYPEFVEYLEGKLGEYRTRIIGNTLTNLGDNRCDRYLEIQDWLRTNPAPLKYAILDDVFYKMKQTFGENFFATNPEFGLTEKIHDDIIKYLNKP